VRRRSEGRNGRRRFVLIHAKCARRERARERLASGVRVASEVLNNEGRGHHPISVIPSASERPHQNSRITQANLGIQPCTREIPRRLRSSG
jgi:hypothetical protein